MADITFIRERVTAYILYHLHSRDMIELDMFKFSDSVLLIYMNYFRYDVETIQYVVILSDRCNVWKSTHLNQHHLLPAFIAFLYKHLQKFIARC